MSNAEPTLDPQSPQLNASRSLWAERAGPIFWAGLVVGMILAIGGFASLHLTLVGNTTGQLILCSGLGVLFGAFGSTATAKHKGVVITGVATIAIALLLVVDYLIKDNYVELEIKGDIAGAQIEVVGDVNYLGAPRRRSHNFIIIAREIRRTLMTVSINLPPEAEDQSETEYLFECVHKKEVERFLGSGQIIQWRFDKENGHLVDSNAQRTIAEVGPCPRSAKVSPIHEQGIISQFAALGLSLFSEAAAADRVDLKALFRDLEAGSAYTRRQARKSLAAQGLPAVRPMLDRLSGERVSYRTRLGIIVAMTEFLRENKSKNREVSELLTEEELSYFVDAAADKDRTIRVYATEFLYDLADLRVVEPIFDRFDTADHNGRYNLLVVLEGVYPYVEQNERRLLEQTLSEFKGSVGPKTKELIHRIVGQSATSEQRYWVIVGSYTDASEARAHAARINREDDSLEAFVGVRQPNNPYYPVIVGDYVTFQQANELAKAALQLKSVREYGAAPYLSAYADRRQQN